VLPEQLRFKATGSQEDIVQRFLFAIRLNPESPLQLYLQWFPGMDTGNWERINASALTTTLDTSYMINYRYYRLVEGEKVLPIYIVAAANDEPDFGFDIGLFEDNGTWFGAKYGFGNQSFGNPNLEFSSQAPFHMGFYHQSWIAYAAAPFLERTFPEYRIHLFKTLAEYAFMTGHDYWGWRFLGWSMHYLGDLSMPYHSSVLPGVSTFRMLWINTKAIIGFPRSRDAAVQLVSNQHMVMEKFIGLELQQAFARQDFTHPFIVALKNPVPLIAYRDDFPRQVVAKEAANKGGKTVRALTRNVPKVLVKDPDVEVTHLPEMRILPEHIRIGKGAEAVDNLSVTFAPMLSSFSMHMKSLIEAVTQRGS
ncbi:MAG TPA: hypothetical protein VLH16_00035, partial [Bacteroidales bacterium]|nr:hypothetical protein [Bacteroidales bacterium]